MTVANAMNFIDQGLADSALRGRLNSASSKSELTDFLADEKLSFSEDELSEAFLHKLTQCQSTEAADQLKEFRMWWELLQQAIKPSACGSSCAGCKP